MGALTGTYVHNVDEKGRLAVPSKLRVELGEPFFITFLSKECLTVFPKNQWDKFCIELNNVPQSDRKAQRSVRVILANAVKCEPDKQGRVLLPQTLRSLVGIEKEVVTIGVSKKAEIWAKDKWDDIMSDATEGDDLLSNLAQYGI